MQGRQGIRSSQSLHLSINAWHSPLGYAMRLLRICRDGVHAHLSDLCMYYLACTLPSLHLVFVTFGTTIVTSFIIYEIIILHLLVPFRCIVVH